MATGTFTYNALRTKTLKERIKTQRKIICKSFRLDKSKAVSIGTTAVKTYLSICVVGSVWFARYCGKMYSRHLFLVAASILAYKDRSQLRQVRLYLSNDVLHNHDNLKHRAAVLVAGLENVYKCHHL